MTTPSEREQRIRERVGLAKSSAVGLQFAISIAIGAFAGHWLDNRFDTEPWLLLTGVLFGSAAGFRDLYRLAKSQSDDAPTDP